MPKTYILDADHQFKFQQIYVLLQLEEQGGFPITVPGELRLLEEMLGYLVQQNMVFLSANGLYQISELGREGLKVFRERYMEYLTYYDIFCAVDRQSVEFALTSRSSMTESQWQYYVNNPRFDDLRVAVAEYKVMDPLEIVFMSFICEGRFRKPGWGWCFDLMGGILWDEIVHICSTALQWWDIGGEDVIQDIIVCGMDQVALMWQQEEEQRTTQQPDVTYQQVQEVVEYRPIVVMETVNRYHSDPFYVSPIWFTPYVW